jgi:hypothetical protein
VLHITHPHAIHLGMNSSITQPQKIFACRVGRATSACQQSHLMQLVIPGGFANWVLNAQISWKRQLAALYLQGP